METVLVQISDSKAYKLLEDMENLHIIKVLKKNSDSEKKLSDKYAGKLPADIADDLQHFVDLSRKEWDSSI